MTAEEFIDSLKQISPGYEKGIPKREIFALAKIFETTPVSEVIRLLRNENHDYRIGAIAILDWKARNKKTNIKEKEEAYHAYLNNHDFIDDWGLVDRAAPYVIGGYLFDKNRMPLYELAKSKNPLERRTAIVSTYFFIRQNDIEDTFNLAEILVHDSEKTVQTGVGSWIREAGKRDEQKLVSFLDQYASTMPRIMLRYAVEKLDPDQRNHYMNLGKLSSPVKGPGNEI